MESLENWMPEPANPIVTDWDAHYKKQRYERLLDSLVEYTEDQQGADEFLRDLRKGLGELAKPQLDTLEAIKQIQDLIR